MHQYRGFLVRFTGLVSSIYFIIKQNWYRNWNISELTWNRTKSENKLYWDHVNWNWIDSGNQRWQPVLVGIILWGERPWFFVQSVNPSRTGLRKTGQSSPAYLEAVKGGLWWVDNEVAQSEAESLRVLLEENGPWALPWHALHLAWWQRPAPVLIGRHHAISSPFSLLRRENGENA